MRYTRAMADTAHTFREALLTSLRDESFVKLTLSGYRGNEAGLQKILARPVLIKQQPMVSFTYRYKTRDVVKNYDVAESVRRVAGFLGECSSATLFTTGFDLQYYGKKLKRSAPSQPAPASLAHDRAKQRVVASSAPYLHALGLTDAAGTVHASAQDKFRQIDKYIEILGGLVAKLPAADAVRVADMGAGKGYLTFALYEHLRNAKRAPSVVGVEYRADLVALCNRIAADVGFTGLKFVEGAIDGFDATGTDILIALHACDTATDDAIAKGVAASANLIVVAPCCHKQIRREMDAVKPAASLDFLLRHGSFMERQAEMVTDGLRALLLELHGYRTNVFEFISDAHTPKNIMITALRDKVPTAARRAQLEQDIARAKEQFGIRTHYLEGLLA